MANRSLLIALLIMIVTLNLATPDSLGCMLVGRPDVATRPSFMLDLQIDRQITDVSILQKDISQAFKFVKRVGLDTSDTVRYYKDIPYYAEAIWSRGRSNYDLLIYYVDTDRSLQRAAGIDAEYIKYIKIHVISFYVVGLEDDCSISPSPDKFISIMNTLESPTQDIISRHIDKQETVKSVSLEMVDDVTGKLVINYNSGSAEETVNGYYEPSVSYTSYPGNPLLYFLMLLIHNWFYLAALILVGGLIALVIYIIRGR
ncbi:MAG: hypothetical protein QXU32_09920 [Nitrososphaerales archaeon]